MHKAIAEFLAAFIPHKMTRNRWRGILRYGLIRAVKLKKLLKAVEFPPRHYLTICAIAKNEGAYFAEWIEWHRNLGVERFYIYDNESTDNTREVLEPYIKSGLVEYVFWKGKKMQLAAYDDCLERHRLDSCWIAVIDLDEFIVPVKDRTIPEFLKRHEDFAAVEINWLVYGSGGAKEKTDGSVMERFKCHAVHSHVLNRNVKSIVAPRSVLSFIGCHEVAVLFGHSVDSNGNKIKKNFYQREPLHDTIRINHYAVKSFEEFKQKQARGRARTNAIRSLNYFYNYDLNDIEEKSR